jgi:transcription antitermination protein NusB
VASGGARTKARRRALEVLFEADLREADPVKVLRERLARRAAEGPGSSDPMIQEYAVTLVEGVAAHQARIDELLSLYATGWPLDRMPAVDRNILRLGAYELIWGEDDVPDAVVLAEAISLATELSTDDSPQFVNGMLATLVDLKPTLTR